MYVSDTVGLDKKISILLKVVNINITLLEHFLYRLAAETLKNIKTIFANIIFSGRFFATKT